MAREEMARVEMAREEMTGEEMARVAVQPTATYSILPLHCPLLAVEASGLAMAEPWRGLRRRAPL